MVSHQADDALQGAHSNAELLFSSADVTAFFEGAEIPFPDLSIKTTVSVVDELLGNGPLRMETLTKSLDNAALRVTACYRKYCLNVGVGE